MHHILAITLVFLTTTLCAFSQTSSHNPNHRVTWESGREISRDCVDSLSLDSMFVAMEVPDSIFSLMQGKSYPQGCPVERTHLRYLHLLHINLNGNAQMGEMVVHKDIAQEVVDIFRQLYLQAYPIEKMLIIDRFDADDNTSMAANNTSCFNYRKISGSRRLSNHAHGKAIDINPLYNPMVRTRGGRTTVRPPQSRPYIDRTRKFPCKITRNDIITRLFIEKGWRWGGNYRTAKDWQHFEKKNTY